METATATFEIINNKGLHVRAATLLAQKAAAFESTISVEHVGERANAKSVMNLLLLTAPVGATVHVIASGSDAEAAVAAIGELILSGFGE